MVRGSKQRDTVLEAVKEGATHPTAADVYDRARLKIPNISLGTVYRNLDVLKKSGEIIGFSGFDGVERFDATTRNHGHFFCKGCEKIFDFCPDEYLAEPIPPDMKQNGFTADSVRVLIHGYCNECKNK